MTYSFRPYHDPGVDSAPSENDYQENFQLPVSLCLGIKRPGRQADYSAPYIAHVKNERSCICAFTCVFWHPQGQINVLLLLNIYEIRHISLNGKGHYMLFENCDVLRNFAFRIWN